MHLIEQPKVPMVNYLDENPIKLINVLRTNPI